MLALETDFGRRARSMRIFPGFRLDQDTSIDPSSFSEPPTVALILPNYIRIAFEPVPNLKVTAEFWAKESNLIGGRYQLYNAHTEPIRPEMLLHAQLLPDEASQPMTSRTEQGAIVLHGSTGNLMPVLFLSGGARAAIAPYPALSVWPWLDPGASELFTWAHAACSDLQDSFSLARELIADKWDAEIARVEQANIGLVDIETGDPDWDTALFLAQTTSVASFVGPTEYHPHASIVRERAPSRGYSAHPEGRDHEHGWEGVSLADAYVPLLQILPIAPELAKGIVLNFLADQAPDGTIDWNSGLAGQRSSLQSIPMLAHLSWRIYTYIEDKEFLNEVYPRLRTFLDSWFEPEQDADQDGIPEWHTTLQSGFENWPAFYRHARWAQGVDILLAETPDLASYLYAEITALLEIGKVLERTEEEQDLSSRQILLGEVIEQTWSEQENSYLAQDRDLNRTVAGSRVGQGEGELELDVENEFEPPVRVLFRVYGEEQERRSLKVIVRGKATAGRKRVHEWKGRSFQWANNFGTLTTDVAFVSIKQITLQGLSPDTKTEVRIADYSRLDHTGLLPLWAGVPGKDRANQLVRKTITDPHRYWRPYGVPLWPADGLAYRYAQVQMRSNLMVGEGLVRYGYLKEAAELVARLLAACVHTLKQDRGFREFYHPDELGGEGPIGHSSGAAPLSLFLDVLGVRLISPRKVALRGQNPFGRPMRLRYRGIEIAWNEEGAQVVFADGGKMSVTGREIQLVEETDG